MNFLDYPAYVIGCLGVGDIICSLNALENIGREKQRIIQLYVCHEEYKNRAFDIYNNLDTKNVNLQFLPYDKVKEQYGDNHTVFQAFGNNVSWVDYWLKCWGLSTFTGYKNMISIRNNLDIVKNRVAISFTVTSNKDKNVSEHGIFSIIDKLINDGKNIIYFGYRGDDDINIYSRYKDKIDFCIRDINVIFDKMRTCEEFIGADSGMAWISTFSKIKTTIIIGEKLTYIPYAFSDIPWVNINKEEHTFREVVKSINSEKSIQDIKSHLLYINGKINDDHNLLIKHILGNTYKTNRHGIETYSQLGQDNFVYDILECKRNGIFVDIGASEPITYSNTYGLEKCLNWTGILVENNKNMIEMLKNQRTSIVYDRGFEYQDNQSNINDIIEKVNSSHIDYISIDIDGGEYEVVKTIDYNRFTFSIIDLEHDIYRNNQLNKRNKIKDHLLSVGYDYFYSVGVDDIFISKSLWSQADNNFNKNYGYDIRVILP